MAKVTAPLFSFTATGKIAKSLVYSAWKGIQDVRGYVTPANPNTPAQQTQRTLIGKVVLAWRTWVTDPTARIAWNVAASVGSMVQSGYNAFVSSAAQVLATVPAASYVVTFVAGTGGAALATLKNMDDGATADETGNFEVWLGSKPNSLLKTETVTISTGVFGVALLGTPGDIVYVQIRKDGFARSGIYKLTVQDE